MKPEKAVNLITWTALVVISLAWHFPGEMICAALSWAGCLLLAHSLPRSNKPYAILYAGGMALYAIGFYWLFFTIRDFGGFSNFWSLSIFLLFVLVSATQFLILVFIWKHLPRFFHRNCLALAFAWLAAELLSLKIFPWCLGHSQLAYRYFAQIVDIGGAPLVSFFMIYFSELLVRRNSANVRRAHLFGAVLLFIVINLYGFYRVRQFKQAVYPEQTVTLVQANISIEEKHNVLLPVANLNRYIELSRSHSKAGDLVIWPESVFTEFVRATIKSVEEDSRLPFLPGRSLLFGGLTFESRSQFYNSAMAVSHDGELAGLYHKQILMPFGEYTPFAGIFPWLKDINSTAGQFSAGTDVKVLTFKNPDGSEVRLSPLICYEDVVPGLARKAALRGADILVNMTNDAWFGDTIAPLEHNLIAAFRAIENRRVLVRATNTGFTAIISPLGEIAAKLRPYSEGVIRQSIQKVDFRPPTSYYDPYLFLKLLSLVLLFGALINIRRDNSRQP